MLNLNELYAKEEAMRLSMCDEDMYCFCEFMDVSGHIYDQIASVCRAKGVRKVYDIGCAVPFQAKIFAAYGIAYVGVDTAEDSFTGWAKENGISCMTGHYPFPINAEPNACIVSSFCLGYFAQGEATYRQMKADFRHFAGFIGMQKEFDLFRRNFNVTDSFGDELPLFFADRDAAVSKKALNSVKAIYKKLEKPVFVS